MSQFPPLRVIMHMDSGVVCYGHIYKKVLDIPVGGTVTQMWVYFEDNKFPERYILDSSIIALDVVHRARDICETGVFSNL
jgi:hypothetical protein